MSKRIDVRDANRYSLKQNTPAGGKNGYVSFEFGFRRNNGDLPGEVKLDLSDSTGGSPITPDNCGCK